MRYPKELSNKLSKLKSKFDKERKQLILQHELLSLESLKGKKIYTDLTNIHIECGLADFKCILHDFPAINDTHVIRFAGKDDIMIKSPFSVRLANPPQIGVYSKFTIQIKWIAMYKGDEINISVKMPTPVECNLIRKEVRNITSSEYHYFTGYSQKKLNALKVSKWSFKAKHISWYGGDESLIIPSVISELIEYLYSL